MALLLKKAFKGYIYAFSELADPRAKDYLLTSSPIQPIVLVVFYCFFVFKWGPYLMRNRPPFNIDNILKLFNLSQVILNAYIVFHGTKELFSLNWYCAPVDYSDTPHNIFVFRMVYLYFVLKLADLLDTVFFILRKKENQVTFLHVYHHFGMILVSWFGVKFFAGGQSIYLGVMNSLVHSVMYFYYFLTIWKPQYRQNLWWKKYITQLQLVQFVFFIVTYGQLLFKPNCAYPKIASYVIVPQSMFMAILFSDFYYRAYFQKKPQQVKNQ